MLRRWIAALAIAALLLAPALALASGAEMEMNAEPGPEERETLAGTSVGPLAVVTAQEGMQWMQTGVVKTALSDGVSPLYAAPDSGSDVLMTYYSGAPLQIIRSAGAFYQVQLGRQGASLMGYMRREDVEAGERAERIVAPAYMELQFNREAQIYAYCDEGAQAIGRCKPGKTYYAMGKNDGKWVQLYLPPVNHVWEEEDRAVMGFVKLDTGVARGYWHELGEWTVAPRAGEITPEQAVALAIDHLAQAGSGSLPEVYTRRETLEKMHSRAQYMQMAESLVNDWWVYFWEKEDSDVVRVYVYVGGQGDVSIHHDYIAVGEEGAYNARMTL